MIADEGRTKGALTQLGGSVDGTQPMSLATPRVAQKVAT
jgi:hypothetical protein